MNKKRKATKSKGRGLEEGASFLIEGGLYSETDDDDVVRCFIEATLKHS